MAGMVVGVIFGVIYLIYKLGEDNTGGIAGFICGLLSLGYVGVIVAILAIGFSEECRDIFGIYQGIIVFGVVGYAVLFMSAGIIYLCRGVDAGAIKDDKLYKKDWWITLKALCKMWFWCIIFGIIFRTLSENAGIVSIFLYDTFGNGILRWIFSILYLVCMLGSPFITFGIYYLLRLFKKWIMNLCGLEDNSRPLIEDAIFGVRATYQSKNDASSKDEKRENKNE